MNKRIISKICSYICLIMVLFLIGCMHQSGDPELIIRLNASGLESGDIVYITGNHEKLGTWDPAEVRMQRTTKNIWEYAVNFPVGEELEFKFTLGSWSKEALDSTGRGFQNFKHTVRGDTTLQVSVNSWGSSRPEPQGQITGTVRYHRQIQAEGLLPHDLIVWLPPSYEDELDKSYPVLYMHDGQNIFDPATSYYTGNDWQIDEAMDSLIRADRVRETIVVGINNTTDRNEEYTPGEKGALYTAFVTGTVKPMIDSLYRTLPERNSTFTGGSSAGGLISFMLLWEYTDVFSGGICMSPAFLVKTETFDINIIDDVVNYQGIKKDLKIYIDNGGIGLEEQLQPGVDQMLEALTEMGYREDQLMYVKDENAEHNEAAWAERIDEALVFLIGF